MWQRLVWPFRDFDFGAGLLYRMDRMPPSISHWLDLYVSESMAQPITSKPIQPANLTKILSIEEIERGHPEVARATEREDIKAMRFERGLFAWASTARAS